MIGHLSNDCRVRPGKRTPTFWISCASFHLMYTSAAPPFKRSFLVLVPTPLDRAAQPCVHSRSSLSKTCSTCDLLFCMSRILILSPVLRRLPLPAPPRQHLQRRPAAKDTNSAATTATAARDSVKEEHQ